MALTQIYSQDNLSVSTTELSCTGGTSLIQSRTTVGMVCIVIDCSNIAAGDVFQVRLLEKTQASSDTQREWLSTPLTTSNNGTFISPMFPLIHGWDWTIQKISGTDRTFDISVRAG